MAELTLQRLTDRMARFMGWDSTDWPAEILPATIANEAGNWLFSAVEWNFLEGASADLNVVASQSFITLPADFGSTTERSITSRTYGSYGIRLETMVQVQQARQIAGASSFGSYVGAIIWEDPAGDGVMPRARLELGPIPSASLTAAFTLGYRKQWVDVNDPEDTCRVPAFIAGLYTRAACLWLAGYEADAETTLEDRMDRLMLSSLWTNAISQDANTQQGIGTSTGSAASEGGDDWPAGLPIVRIPIFV